MRYTSANEDSYGSTRQGNIIKRVLLLITMTVCLVFVGAQTTPGTHARVACDLVCGDPFIDPNDGQCYQLCCPADPSCGTRCELRLCKKGS